MDFCLEQDDGERCPLDMCNQAEQDCSTYGWGMPCPRNWVEAAETAAFCMAWATQIVAHRRLHLAQAFHATT